MSQDQVLVYEGLHQFVLCCISSVGDRVATAYRDK